LHCRGWIQRRHFSADEKGTFSILTQDREGRLRVLKVHRLAHTVIQRHIKVRGDANPYDPDYVEYFEKRRCCAWRTYPVGNTRAFGTRLDTVVTQNANNIKEKPDCRITSAEADLRKAWAV
jgi:hypothetical protein